MSITVVYPTVNQKFGPGFLVYATSSFIGPVGVNSFWNARLYDSTLVDLLMNTTGADAAKSVSCIMGIMRPTPGNAFATQYFFSISAVDARALDGSTCKLVVEFIDGSTHAVIETTTINVTLDMQMGVAALFPYLAVVLQQSAVGVDLAAIKAAVIPHYSNP